MSAKIGAMRERVQVQAEVQTADGGGGFALSWNTVATCWARVRPLGGREQAARGGREQAARGGQEAAQMYEVTIRKQATAVTPQHRLLWGSVALNIRSVPNLDERGEFLTITCEGGVIT